MLASTLIDVSIVDAITSEWSKYALLFEYYTKVISICRAFAWQYHKGVLTTCTIQQSSPGVLPF